MALIKTFNIIIDNIKRFCMRKKRKSHLLMIDTRILPVISEFLKIAAFKDTFYLTLYMQLLNFFIFPVYLILQLCVQNLVVKIFKAFFSERILNFHIRFFSEILNNLKNRHSCCKMFCIYDKLPELFILIFRKRILIIYAFYKFNKKPVQRYMLI